MDRNAAIALLAARDLARLSPARREALLLGWWSIDADHPEYDPLLLLALHHAYYGVLNSYLQNELRSDEAIEGLPEPLVTCPACCYRNLRERGGYEICLVLCHA